MTRKLLACLTALLIIFAALPMGAAAKAPTITVGSAKASAGDSVSVDVTMSDNPGICCFTFGVEYDAQRLTLEKAEVAAELKGQSQVSKKIVWLGSSDTKYNGKILTLTFKVPNNAPSGDAKVSLTYNAGDISNYNEDDVDFTIVPGKITVSGKSTKKTDPAPAVTAKRMGGSDRYDTANIICQSGWTKAETVIIASGESYPDALAGAVLAKKLNAPILLTGKSAISSDTLERIEKLGAKKAIILGGKAAVSEDVEKKLTGRKLKVSRLKGDNRNATAAAIAYETAGSGGKAQTAVLVSNAGFADALSVSPAAALMQSPILYLNKDGSVPEETSKALTGLGAKNIYIIGGTAAIGSRAEKELKSLGATVKRIYGNDRYETSVKIYDSFKSVYKSNEAAIATGKNFPDALAGAAFAAGKSAPIFLAGNSASDAVKSRLTAAGVKTLYVFGGKSVISEDIVKAYTS